MKRKYDGEKIIESMETGQMHLIVFGARVKILIYGNESKEYRVPYCTPTRRAV